ncbi:metallophosphoesterase [Candidatus Saccharibacteria bacterium]|nr:metallophosphoesterase [Candidatus Saccharibacteria bacterium]
MKLKEPTILKMPEVRVFDGPVLATVAVSGDWHISPIVSDRQLEMLKKAFLKIRPELIVLQGDLMDSPAEFQRAESVKKLYKWFRLCMSFAPTVMVLGSHDYIEPRQYGKVSEAALSGWQKVCDETGVRLLNDEWFETEHIRIFGMKQGPDYCLTAKNKHRNNPEVFEKHLEQLIHDGKIMAGGDKARWFIAHAPDMTKGAERILSKNFDIASFGHTHGGCLPLGIDTIVDKVGGHGGLISATNRPLPANVRGVKKIGKMTKIINSGMVATQNCAPKATQYLNFAKAAEVTFVKIGTRKLA